MYGDVFLPYIQTVNKFNQTTCLFGKSINIK